MEYKFTPTVCSLSNENEADCNLWVINFSASHLERRTNIEPWVRAYACERCVCASPLRLYKPRSTGRACGLSTPMCLHVEPHAHQRATVLWTQTSAISHYTISSVNNVTTNKMQNYSILPIFCTTTGSNSTFLAQFAVVTLGIQFKKQL